MRPYYKVVKDKPGVSSGGTFTHKHLWFIYYIIIGGKDNTLQAVSEEPENVYRELQRGGTMFGFMGRNFWVPDDCLLGWALRKSLGHGQK